MQSWEFIHIGWNQKELKKRNDECLGINSYEKGKNHKKQERIEKQKQRKLDKW